MKPVLSERVLAIEYLIKAVRNEWSEGTLSDNDYHEFLKSVYHHLVPNELVGEWLRKECSSAGIP